MPSSNASAACERLPTTHRRGWRFRTIAPNLSDVAAPYLRRPSCRDLSQLTTYHRDLPDPAPTAANVSSASLRLDRETGRIAPFLVATASSIPSGTAGPNEAAAAVELNRGVDVHAPRAQLLLQFRAGFFVKILQDVYLAVLLHEDSMMRVSELAGTGIVPASVREPLSALDVGSWNLLVDTFSMPESCLDEAVKVIRDCYNPFGYSYDNVLQSAVDSMALGMGLASRQPGELYEFKYIKSYN